jgi:geranylgeranyl diphosphate synthase type II
MPFSGSATLFADDNVKAYSNRSVLSIQLLIYLSPIPRPAFLACHISYERRGTTSIWKVFLEIQPKSPKLPRMFDLKQYIEKSRILVDKELHDLLPSKDTRPSILHEALHYCIFSGGKRIRPLLCIAAAEAVGSCSDLTLHAAAAIEILHTYTLVHDDLPCMDDDDLRRGKPTCHKVYGEANAVLVGDALQALAFAVLARSPAPRPYSPIRLVEELAAAAGSTGVVGGQVEDLAIDPDKLDADTLSYIHMKKTAELFKASVRMGAISADASEDQLQKLTGYGIDLGLAFQMTDDILDAGPEDNTNKECSCLSILSPEEAKKKVQEHIDAALEALTTFDELRAAPLRAVAQFVLTRDH